MPTRSHAAFRALPHSRRGSTRTAGLVVAAVLAAASIGTVSFFLLTRSERTGQNAPALLPNDGAVPPPELIQAGKISTRAGTPTSTGGKGIKVDMASRNDPTRLAGRILSASLDPLEGNRYRADLPQSYLYLKDGRTIYIRSDTAKFLLPQGPSGQPDSGVLDGNVIINVFDRRADGAEIDIAKDSPSLKLSTSTLTFDMTTGQFTGPDRFVVTGPTVDFAGTGLNILYNQRNERLELLTIAKSETLTLRPKNRDQAGSERESRPADGAAPAPNAPAQPAPAAQASPASPAAPPRIQPETFYHAVFHDTVKLRQGDRTIDGDLMELWLHLVDNQLSPNAIAQAKPSKAAAPDTKAVAPAAGSAEAQPAARVARSDAEKTGPRTAAPPLASGRDEVLLDWSGPLEIRPLGERPPALKGNEVAARFSSMPGAFVAFKDGDSKGEGTSSTLDYGATTRDIAMGAPQPRGVHLTLPSAGEIFAQRLSINLNTGVASVPSAGELRSLGKGTGLMLTGDNDTTSPLFQDDPSPTNPTELADSQGVFASTPSAGPRVLRVNAPLNRIVTWNEQADFLFATSNGTMTGSLLSATLAGEVRGTDRYSGLNAGWLQVEFLPAAARAEGKTGATVLKRLQARDNTNAWDGRGGNVSAQRLDVLFDPRPDAPTASDPVLVTLAGSATAMREDTNLFADLIEARLVRGTPARGTRQGAHDPNDGRTEVSDVLARGNILFARNDGTWAQGDEIRANTATQIADLLGEHAAIGKDNTRIEGTQMRLDGSARSLEVFGPGTFRFGGPRNLYADITAFGVNAPEFGADGKARPDAPLPAENGTASWTLGMTFDDKSGFVDCRGGVNAEMNHDPTSQRTLSGEKLHVELTPGTMAQGSPTSDTSTKERRTLLRAAISGSLDDTADGARASVQSTTFELPEDPAQPRRMIGLQYLEGSTIRADDVLGTLTVPGAGRLLVADRKPGESPAHPATTLANGATRPPGSSELSPSTRGDSLFTWQGSFVADRNANTAIIRGGARITHQLPGSPDATELESEEVVAYVSDSKPAQTPPNSNTDQLRVRLTRATAAGAVWARSAGKELTADRLDYDAAGRMMTASGSENNDVILFDPAKPSPITAKLLEWDLARDRVSVKKPGTVVVPADIVKRR